MGLARAGVALVLLAALAAAQSPTPPSPTPPPPPKGEPEDLPLMAPGLAPYFNKPKFTACVINAPPYSSCGNTIASSAWTGYDIELFKRAMPYMGWTDLMVDL
jgi:hypothetical protein